MSVPGHLRTKLMASQVLNLTRWISLQNSRVFSDFSSQGLTISWKYVAI